MAKINNILSGREACALLGVKNVQSIVSKFMDYKDAKSKNGSWHVSELCRAYDISDHAASEHIQKLIRAGRIAGPLLISR